ncbi:UNVERIFIED_CONTAM: Alpha-N-acetylglucosaminidase [Sesamum latifolium]|uniref:Alpha-N-acetylglucosaminidase n=1 Tax=Sesamum latifolium TaxID=2727402 RepID=A0AAW2UY12_9LAMI
MHLNCSFNGLICHVSYLFQIFRKLSASENFSNHVINRISGTTAVELLSGLHWYLKYWCGAHISWSKTGGPQLSSVPKSGSLPRIQDAGITMKRPTPWSYYQNAVSSSYTFAWWDWERWEKEIDWMALQGINLPLAFTGQEAIWQKVFQDFNISAPDLDDFFGGPAFLAWSRMGNLHGWGGPLPQSWLDQQLILQKKILARMYELGMNPVLPAFSGNVPAALKSVYPSAKITRLGNWFTVRSDQDGAVPTFLMQQIPCSLK